MISHTKKNAALLKNKTGILITPPGMTSALSFPDNALNKLITIRFIGSAVIVGTMETNNLSHTLPFKNTNEYPRKIRSIVNIVIFSNPLIPPNHTSFKAKSRNATVDLSQFSFPFLKPKKPLHNLTKMQHSTSEAATSITVFITFSVKSF